MLKTDFYMSEVVYSCLERDSFNGESGSGRIIMPLIDARMDEFNCGCYKVNDLGFVSPMTTDQLLSRSNALALIDEHKPEVIIGEGHMLFLDEMENYTRVARSIRMLKTYFIWP